MADANPDIVVLTLGNNTLGLKESDLEDMLQVLIDASEGPLGDELVNPALDVILNSELGGLLGGALEATWAARDGLQYETSYQFAEQNPLFAKLAAAGDGTPEPMSPKTQAAVDAIKGLAGQLTGIVQNLTSDLATLTGLLPDGMLESVAGLILTQPTPATEPTLASS